MGHTILESTEHPVMSGITNTVFAGPLHHERDEDGAEMVRSRNAAVVSPGRIDRAPCGTGTSARIDSTTTVGPYDAVVPSVSRQKP